MKQPQPSASPAPHPIPDSAVEAFRAAYASHGSQKGYADAIRAGLAAATPLVSQDAMLSLEQEAHAHLVQQLDIALNGEAAAARAPVLAELLSQCQAEAQRRHGPVLATIPGHAAAHLRKGYMELADSARALSETAMAMRDKAVRELVVMGITEVNLLPGTTPEVAP
ncbi:hypothetical protein SSKA14_1328 [Stenotrophomonas sp. SKA14]|uniref:hypothetical protein n=1 Tax=Stenotrophomonas TaxID=40323 RepID=UPI00018FE987|nr:hypothetical protein [Stenotrophomonas sp. SKA14]EED38317.1 hypothetical protein SSKA14_1328 [Stenotrophomonas sp. SKA14]